MVTSPLWDIEHTSPFSNPYMNTTKIKSVKVKLTDIPKTCFYAKLYYIIYTLLSTSNKTSSAIKIYELVYWKLQCRFYL